MRFEGTLKTWHDDRGFGFIEPAQGGDEIFVHIKACRRDVGRPQLGQRLSFEVELSPEGKKRAKNVEPLSAFIDSAFNEAAGRGRVRKRRVAAPVRSGIATLFAIPAFVVLYATVALIWHVPAWVAGLYAGASLLCMLVYAADKSAAVAGRWRVSEGMLLMLGLLGGWPGALIAQQVLRHKSSKTSFRAEFWGTVVLNVCAFVVLNSPLLAVLRA